MATDTQAEDSDSDGDYDTGSFIPKKKCKDIRGCADLYIYLKQNPRTAAAAIMFTSSIVLLLFLGVGYAIKFHPNSCYFVAGIGGIVSNVYGALHFRTLMSLKKEVDTYSSNNKKFAEENGQLSGEVNRFTTAKDELSDTQKRIRSAIKRQSENLGKFRELNKNLQATGKQNMELLTNLNDMSQKMENKWRDELVKKERKILHVCFDRFEWEDGADGISREQFTQFKLTLPMEYQLRLTRSGDWKEIAGDDGILQLDEFVQLLDNFADEVARSKHEKNMSEVPDGDELKKITDGTDDYKDGENS
eukprot:CAMPEP_0197047668 /NCGR_PEP_ID=MMETSP1384-20130603/23127_1 /TAXON_ID=29189 /ORGANISM="Ammonia sp." /LENGTH=303 /DNA_ID=CAMNT_0042479641 /DNA_START=132 /DNA_END=1043 /DNA_ORIENTATION=+